MPPRNRFDKYAAYAQAVQSPADDVRFLRRIYREQNGREPALLREDFCGAFALCCEWAKLDAKKIAVGQDIDPEPLAYGKKHYLPELATSARHRVKALRRDVLGDSGPRADIICALNFSYYTFHSRETMLRYLKTCRRSLRPRGTMVLDSFGGPLCEQTSIDVKKLPGLTYYWEQENFDPINNRARFHIHFKPKGGRKRNRCFTYDWRMWTIPELRDLMLEAGFKSVTVYWEGTARDGSGSGKFYARKKGEWCEVWLAYIVGTI